MVEHFTSLPNGQTDKMVKGIKLLATNVISRAGYGQNLPWTLQESEPKFNTTTSFFDSLHVLINNFAIAAIVPSNILLSGWMHSWVRQIGKAKTQFPSQVNAILDEERHRLGLTDANSSSLLSMLVEQQNKAGAGGERQHSNRLDRDEVHGNLFIVTMGGFETTANTLTYATSRLAACPEWQAWVVEELNYAFGDDEQKILMKNSSHV